MVAPPKTAAARRQVLAVVVGSTVVGALLAWAGLDGVLPPLHAMARAEPLIAFSPHDVIALPLAVTCFAWVVLELPGMFAEQGVRDERRGAPRSRRNTALFGLMIAGVLTAIIISPIVRAMMVQVMANHGYSVCPESSRYERHPPVRFVSATGHCP